MAITKEFIRSIMPVPLYKFFRHRYGNTFGIPVDFCNTKIRLLPEYVCRDYETSVQEQISQIVQRGNTVIDCGAYVGIYTIALAKLIGDDGHVYAFEPTQETRQVLKRHVHLNRVDRSVTIEPIAISDSTGEVTLWASGVNAGNSLNYESAVINEKYTGIDTMPYVINQTTLDNYCFSKNIIPSVIKIDVEGAELKVLYGAKRILSKYRPFIFLEMHPFHLPKSGGNSDELLEFMKHIGYAHKFLENTDYYSQELMFFKK